MHGGAVYASVSDTARLVQVAMADDGSAGEATLVAEGIGIDDFAIAPDGTVYATTHPFNTLEAIAPGGSRAVIAGAGQGIVGPTAAALVTTDGGAPSVYVVTDGGGYAPLPGGVGPGTLFHVSLPSPMAE